MAKKIGSGSFINISGATSASYTTPVITSANEGDTYRAIVTNSQGTDQTWDTPVYVDFQAG